VSASGQERLVLAIETTAPRPGAALARVSGLEVRLLSEQHLPASSGRAETLAETIGDLFRRSDTHPAHLSAIAVVDGPGSYTALRIGLGLTRGLAFLDGVPVAPVSSLEVVAESARGRADHVCAVLDAGRGRVYMAGFERSPDGRAWRETHAPLEVAVSDIDRIRSTWSGTYLLCGDESLEPLLLDVAAPATRAANLARLGAERLLDGHVVAAEEVLPRYVGATGARANRAGIAAERLLVR